MFSFESCDDDVLLDGAQQRAFFGGVSEMWLWRREQASRRERARRAREGLPAEPGPDEPPLYPLPKYIGPRKFQKAGNLRRYAAALPSVKPPGNAPPPRRKAEQQPAATSSADAAQRWPLLSPPGAHASKPT
jgi:hypothetical protein